MTYEHIQYGYWGLGTFVFVLIMAAITLPEAFDDSTIGGWALVAALIVIAVITLWFSKLTLTIEGSELSAAFGPGRPRKTFDLKDVASVAPVRNTWIQGWGLRKISGGWMYNVWGLDAVEFTMKSDEVVRVGTNDVDNLLASVRMFTG